MPDGQFVNAGVFSLLGDERSQVFQALFLPFAVVMIGLVGLVVTKRLFVSASRGLKRRR